MAVIVGRKLFCAVKTAQQNMIIFKNVRNEEKDMRFFLYEMKTITSLRY